MKNNLFAHKYNLTLSTAHGHRHISFSNFHKWLAIIISILFSIIFILLSATTIQQFLSPQDDFELELALRNAYEEKIEALSTERQNLSAELAASKENIVKLVENLGKQQDIIFETEREKSEIALNLASLRIGLVNKQNSLDALNLQLETQQKQYAALSSGETITDSATLSAITKTLTETAIARDEARNEVQVLQEKIAINNVKIVEQQKRRDILFSQIEEAVETSLSPLKSTISRTGLNVDSLLKNIRSSYGGVGGIDVGASHNLFGGSSADEKRVSDLIRDLDQLSLYSYAIQTLPLANPVRDNYRMSSGFGFRIHPVYRTRKMHTGQDMAAPLGTPIYAPGNGRVTFAGRKGGYGNTIEIQHEHGISTLYAHLSRIQVNVGQHVKLGQQIAKMGSTGVSTGSHLHYEVRINGNPVNPNNFLKASKYVQ